MTHTKNMSFVFMALLFIILGKIQLMGAFLIILFSYMALSCLQFQKKRWVGIALFFVMVTLVFYSFGFVINKAIIVIPKVVEQAIPKVVEYAAEQEIDLPFSDVDSLRSVLTESVTNQLASLASFAKLATKQFVFVFIALVMAINLFLRNSFKRGPRDLPCQNMLDEFKCSMSDRFANFYESFRLVMGAQVIISAINTTLTGIFVFSVGVPYPFIIIFFTFLCGLLPVIGNIISNTLIVGISLTVSIKLTLISLTYLVIIHKLEYFLNSKIIGGRINTPMWMTLLGLVAGEKLMGLPGMVVAPVLLHYVKIELSALPPGYFSPKDIPMHLHEAPAQNQNEIES